MFCMLVFVCYVSMCDTVYVYFHGRHAYMIVKLLLMAQSD